MSALFSKTDEYGTYHYHAVVTQTDAGGGDIDIRFVVVTGAMFEFRLGAFGPDDYASSRSYQINILDENDNIVKQIGSGSVDNTRPLYIPNFRFEGPTQLQLIISALAQNETVTINQQTIIFDGQQLPAIDVSNSGGTTDVTVTLNKVV